MQVAKVISCSSYGSCTKCTSCSSRKRAGITAIVMAGLVIMRVVLLVNEVAVSIAAGGVVEAMYLYARVERVLCPARAFRRWS